MKPLGRTLLPIVQGSERESERERERERERARN